MVTCPALFGVLCAPEEKASFGTAVGHLLDGEMEVKRYLAKMLT